MKKIQALVAVAFFLSAPAFAAEGQGATFADANARYQKGDFKQAEAAYEKLVADGPTAARLYNLGNASFRNGKKGKALLMYERALAIAPRDADARWNASIVRTALTDRIEAPPGPFGAAVDMASETVSADEAALAFAAALALWALAAFAGFAGARGRLLAAARALAVLSTVATAALFFLVWTAVKDPRAVVMDKEVFARYGPSKRETKAFVLHEGAMARVSDQTKDWLYVTLDNGSSGWIPRESCEIV